MIFPSQFRWYFTFAVILIAILFSAMTISYQVAIASITDGTLSEACNQILIDKASLWKFLDSGVDLQSSDWQTIEFEDEAWSEGLAELGYGDEDEQTVLSFGGDKNEKHLTTYLRHSFFVEESSEYESFTIDFLVDDGAVIYLNGKEVLRFNMPGGKINAFTRAVSTVSGKAEEVFHHALVESHLMLDKDNVLAVEIHQRSHTSSDLSFDLRLKGSFSCGSPAPVYEFIE